MPDDDRKGKRILQPVEDEAEQSRLPYKIGLVSDTHGVFDENLALLLAGMSLALGNHVMCMCTRISVLTCQYL